MFGLFTSAQKRAREDAQNWLHLAGKVYHFRRDQLPALEIEALQLADHELRTRLKEKAGAEKLKMGMEKLEGCLRRSGGSFYPKSSMVDNVEFFLVAMILFLGIRAFIVQPFKIPTNSMWPTYNGLTAEVYVDETRAARDAGEKPIGTMGLVPERELPGTAGRALRWIMFGASPRRVIAPVDGEIFIPYIPGYLPGSAPEMVSARKWLVIPDQAKRFTIFVGAEPVTVTVPADFRFDLLMEKLFFAEPGALERAKEAAGKSQRTVHIPVAAYDRSNRLLPEPQRLPAYLLPTGKRVRAGEFILAFDVMTGDQLFVDRVSYHFARPKAGDGFVFRTHHILGIERPGTYSDKYYIKRLVGVPGDTLEVKEHTLYRNGSPIEGAAAFQKNARQTDGYPGYVASGRLAPGRVEKVEPGFFFAMGDNSPDSADGRVWGYVPGPDVVGRPLWVYFPLTRRWGSAR